MSMLELIPTTDIRLNLVSRPVETEDDIIDLIDNLYIVAGANATGEKRRTLVGLAAPQIGANLRVILVDVEATGEKGPGGAHKIYINPMIISHSETKNFNREGCFSTGMVCGYPSATTG